MYIIDYKINWQNKILEYSILYWRQQVTARVCFQNVTSNLRA